MKIAIVGYGRMGHAVEEAALRRGHEIVCRIDADNPDDYDSQAFFTADVAIEFTTPATAVDNYRRILDRGVRLVSGTTGWNARMHEVEELVAHRGGTFFWTSNFSLGVNIFFAMNRRLAEVMQHFPQYSVRVAETHHIHKLDRPSGTAVTIAGDILARVGRYDAWRDSEGEAPAADTTIDIDVTRRGEEPGTHTVTWSSQVDRLTLEHASLSRRGLAEGAVAAAEWLVAQPAGMHTMDEFMDAMLKS